MHRGTVNEEGTKRTPQYFTYMDGLKELKSICGQLGMTIDSRMKLVVPTPDDQNNLFTVSLVLLTMTNVKLIKSMKNC